jgi:phage terminase large subunit-like protein
LEKYDKVIDFISHLKHFEDQYAGQPFILLPWQRWIVSNVFCWHQPDDHTKRVIRNVFLLISRKNGKTALSAAIMLASMIVDGVAGAECYLVANSRD